VSAHQCRRAVSDRDRHAQSFTPDRERKAALAKTVPSAVSANRANRARRAPVFLASEVSIRHTGQNPYCPTSARPLADALQRI